MIDKIYKLQLENKTHFTYQVLLTNVKNTKQLREMIFSSQLKCCLIKPGVIVDPWIVSIAANKALEKELNNSMTTKSIYTETLYNLSSSKNISESLKQFSAQDNDTDVLVMIVTKGETCEEIENIVKQIEGNIVPIEQLKELCDTKLICKLHSIGEKELKISSLSNCILSHMAYKDFK